VEAAKSSEARQEGAPRPEVAYLILTHKDPPQVEALAARILELSPRGHVVVHHDLEADTLPWDGRPPARVHLVERIAVDWGGWSIVEATRRMLRVAVDQLDAQWIVILSGEHWPVADLAAWEATVGDRGADAFMPAERLPERLHFGRRDLDANRFLARSVHRWFKVGRPRLALAHRALAGLYKVSLLTHPILKLEYSLRGDTWFVGVPRRRTPVRGWELYKGSQWLACNARAARLVLDVDPAVTAWFTRSHIPDESFIQSVLHHAPGIVVDDSVVTWVPPEPELATPGWMLLKERELEQVAASGAVFARKIDPARNPELMRMIDAEVDRRRDAVGAGRKGEDHGHDERTLGVGT
jgi:hypothetical protein